MASVLSKFDTGINYWDANPQMKVFNPFKAFYKKDRSTNKSKSSRTMWGIAMLLEVEDNKLALYPEEDRMNIIAEDHFDNKNFNWEKIDELIKAYEETVLTPSKRALLTQRRKTDERTKFLSSVKYTLENAKELDSLLSNTEKFLSILNKLEESVKLEGNSGNKKGGREESLSEQGII